MSKLPLLQSPDAPQKSLDILAATQAKIGMVPNLYRALAASPEALEAYVRLSEILSGGILSARTRESLAVAIAEANRCEYCLSAHTAIGKMVGMKEEAIELARSGEAADPKTDAILKLACAMVLQRGQLTGSSFEAARAAGVSDAEIAEIAANIGLHTFSNYFNNLIHTDVDFPRVALRT